MTRTRDSLLSSISSAARRIAAKRPASGRKVQIPANILAWRHYDAAVSIDDLQRVHDELWRIVDKLGRV